MTNLKDIDNNLTEKDRKRLEQKYKDYARQCKELEFKNETDKLNLDRDMTIENHKLERMKLKQANCIQTLKNTRDNNKIKSLLSVEKNGYLFKRIGIAFTLISSITSMFGITSNCLDGASIQDILGYWQKGENVSYLIIGFLFFIGELFTSYLLSKQPLIKQYFLDDVKITRFMYVMIYVYCSFIFITSIISNYIFWNNLTHNKLVSIVYSFIFDIGGMFTIFYADYFINLRSKNIFDDLTNEDVHTQDELPDFNQYITQDIIERTETDDNELELQLSMFDTPKEETSEINEITNDKPYNDMMTFELMQQNIDLLQDGEIIKPIKIGMSRNPNYRNWIKKVKNVTYDGQNYIKYNGVNMIDSYKQVLNN